MDQHQLLNKIIQYPDEIEITRLTNNVYRVGYCCQCGSCCKTISLDTRVGANSEEWLKLHNVGVKIKNSIIENPNKEPTEFTASITFPCPCKHLIRDIKNDTYFCEIYNKRPAICQSYPKRTSRWSTCTFIFLNGEKVKWFVEKFTSYWRQQDGKEKKINYR